MSNKRMRNVQFRRSLQPVSFSGPVGLFKRLHLKAAASVPTNAPTNAVSLETSPTTGHYRSATLPPRPLWHTRTQPVRRARVKILRTVCTRGVWVLSNGPRSRQPGANQDRWEEIIREPLRPLDLNDGSECLLVEVSCYHHDNINKIRYRHSRLELFNC